jgi:flavin-dependent dehydrogenase
MDDVIVVGAGPAGSLAALVLARAGLRVRLFDRARFPRPKLCGDTINPGALHILATQIPIARVLGESLPLDGMLLSGPGYVAVRGRYPGGLTGRAIPRRTLDVMLVEQATAAGVQFEDGVAVTAAIVDRNGCVSGVRVMGRDKPSDHSSRMVLAADGRASRLARGLGLARQPAHPRRWAIGGYFEGVDALISAGEMHVRPAHYIGVAPMPDGLANACVVLPAHAPALRDRDHGKVLIAALTRDRTLGARFARARLVEPPQVLGPMAVDATAVGAPGLLLAGDAAGFIDPMTGDGLRFAFSGAILAASTILDVLDGALSAIDAVRALDQARRNAFAAKWRFNRSLRALVASAPAVGVAAMGARVVPSAFEALIRYAGDCHLVPRAA